MLYKVTSEWPVVRALAGFRTSGQVQHLQFATRPFRDLLGETWIAPVLGKLDQSIQSWELVTLTAWPGHQRRTQGRNRKCSVCPEHFRPCKA